MYYEPHSNFLRFLKPQRYRFLTRKLNWNDASELKWRFCHSISHRLMIVSPVRRISHPLSLKQSSNVLQLVENQRHQLSKCTVRSGYCVLRLAARYWFSVFLLSFLIALSICSLDCIFKGYIIVYSYKKKP